MKVWVVFSYNRYDYDDAHESIEAIYDSIEKAKKKCNDLNNTSGVVTKIIEEIVY